MYEELVKRLMYCRNNAAIITDEKLVEIAEEAADAIEGLSKQHEAQRQNLITLINEKPRWIPVEERLPDENGFYLCLYELKQKGDIRMEEALGILSFIDNKWSIFDIYVVTHWLPIPEPPNEEI